MKTYRVTVHIAALDYERTVRVTAPTAGQAQTLALLITARTGRPLLAGETVTYTTVPMEGQ